MKRTLLSILFTCGAFYASAQTNPTPQALPYSQNFNSFDGTQTVYPTGIQGGRVSASAPSNTGRLTAQTLDYALRAPGSAATVSAGVWDYNGKIGFHSDFGADASFLVALNTSSVPATEAINVKFDAMVMRNLYDATSNSFVAGVVFQYRVGTTDNFTILDNNVVNNENAPVSTSGTAPVRTASFSINLPLACSNQPVVQIRWIMRAVSGTALSGGSNRPNFAIDNIEVQRISTLPVHLTSFTAKNESQSVQLNWTTASEQNNSYFDILRAGSDKKFISIGKVKGGGTSSMSNVYTFRDYSPAAGINYYKLLQTDQNGNSEEFGPVSVDGSFSTNSMEVISNFNSSQIVVTVQSEKQDKATIEILDLNGRKLLIQNVALESGFNTIELPATTLVHGLYVAKLRAGSLFKTSKFIY